MCAFYDDTLVLPFGGCSSELLHYHPIDGKETLSIFKPLNMVVLSQIQISARLSKGNLIMENRGPFIKI